MFSVSSVSGTEMTALTSRLMSGGEQSICTLVRSSPLLLNGHCTSNQLAWLYPDSAPVHWVTSQPLFLHQQNEGVGTYGLQGPLQLHHSKACSPGPPRPWAQTQSRELQGRVKRAGSQGRHGCMEAETVSDRQHGLPGGFLPACCAQESLPSDSTLQG